MTARRGKRYSTRSRGAKFAKINDERKQEAAEVEEVEKTLERIPKDEGTEVIEDLVGGDDKEVGTPVVEPESGLDAREDPVEKETLAVAINDTPKPTKAPVKTPAKKKAPAKPKKKPVKKVVKEG